MDREVRLTSFYLALLAFAVVSILLLGAALAVPGLLYYNDYSLPLSVQDAFASLVRYSGTWDATQYMGKPNTIFFGTQIFVGIYAGLGSVFGDGIAAKVMLLGFLIAGAMGMYLTMRESSNFVGSIFAGIFYVANPWTYDQLAQGHIYLLEVLFALPVVALSSFREEPWSRNRWIVVALLYGVIMACDYHFGMLVGVFAGLGILIRRATNAITTRELAFRIGAFALGLLALGIFVVPYLGLLTSILAANDPGAHGFSYFSRFTSLLSSITLARSFMNSGRALSTLPNLGQLWWFLSESVLFVTAVFFVVRKKRWWRTTLGVMLPLLIVAIIIGGGSSSPAGGILDWGYEHIPLSGIFRDPSKLYVFVVLFYCVAIARLFLNPPRVEIDLDGKIRALPVRLILAFAVLVAVMPFALRGVDDAQSLAYPAADAVLANPFLGVKEFQRVAIGPPWNFVKYSWLANPIHDPNILYPSGLYTGINYDFDNSDGNEYLRWAFGQLYFGRSAHFAALARTFGLARFIARSDAEPVTGDPLEDQVLSDAHAEESLAVQQDLPRRGGDSSQAGSPVFYSIGESSIIRTVARVDQIETPSRNVIAALASAGEDFKSAAPCFVNQCPKGVTTLTAGFVDDLSVPMKLYPATVSTALRSQGNPDGFIGGNGAWANSYGELTGEVYTPLYSIGSASGQIAFENLLPGRSYVVYARVMRSTATSVVGLECGAPLRFASVAPILTGFHFWWTKIGTIHATGRLNSCTLRVRGAEVAISDIAAAEDNASQPTRVPPELTFQMPSTSLPGPQQFARHSVSSFSGNSIVLRTGGRLSFRLPELLRSGAPRNVFVHARSRSGGVLLNQGAGISRTVNMARYQWYNLGSLSNGSLEILASSGAVDIDLICYAPFSSGLGAAFRTATPPTLTWENPASREFALAKPAILSVAEPESGFWRIDGLAPTGTMAGYGQLYVLRNGLHKMTFDVSAFYAAGAVLSIVALCIMGFLYWSCRDRVNVTASAEPRV